MLAFILLASSVWLVNRGYAQASSLRPVDIDNELANPNVFTVFSPKEVCYNKSNVILNFSLTAHVIGTVAYSLDGGDVQVIQTSYLTDENDFFVPVLNNSETSKLTVMGHLAFENLPNGNHTLRLYQGHQNLDQFDLFEVDAYTEVNFSVKAPVVLLIQTQTCYTEGEVPLQMLVSEPAGLIYSLDNQANSTLSGNMTLNGLSSGIHNVTVYAFNSIGCWSASNTLDFEVLPHAADNCSPSSTTSISQQPAEFPYLMIVVVFAVLICCMLPVIRYLERANEAAETSK